MVSLNNQDDFQPPFSERPEGILETEEKARLRIATKFGKHPGSMGHADAANVLDWARGARVGELLVELILDGRLLAVKLKEDGEVACRTTESLLKRRELIVYLKRLRRIRITHRTCNECLVEQALKGEGPFLITASEAKRLRLAAETAIEHCDIPTTDGEDVLSWAKRCRREAGQLHGVLAGQVLPVVDATGIVTFRPRQDLPSVVRSEFMRRFDVV